MGGLRNEYERQAISNKLEVKPRPPLGEGRGFPYATF
jgi:hypothetical protein